MQAHNHEASAFAVVCVSAASVGVPAPGCLLLGVLGAWAGDWPDIDAQSSRVVKFFWLLPWIPALAKLASKAVFDLCATDDDIRRTAGSWGSRFRVHRGLWHSVWAALGTGAVWWALCTLAGLYWGALGQTGAFLADSAGVFFGADQPVPMLIGETVALGMIAHVLGDGCTDFGVAPFAPVLKWRGYRYVEMGLWTPLRFKVSKDPEKYLITPLILALAGWAIVGAFVGPWTTGAAWGLALGFLWWTVPNRKRRRWRRKALGF